MSVLGASLPVSKLITNDDLVLGLFEDVRYLCHTSLRFRAFGPPNFSDIIIWVWNSPNILGISLKSLGVVRVELLHGPSLKLGLKLAIWTSNGQVQILLHTKQVSC